jgi:hypothetical protein
MTDRSLTIVAVLAVSLVVGWLLFRGYVQTKPPSEIVLEEPQSIETKRVSRVRARVKECSRVGQSTRLSGSVENTGNTSLSLVTVETLWKNSSGLILGKGLVYVVTQSSPLAPGEIRTFMDVSKLSNVTKCNVEPLDWGA